MEACELLPLDELNSFYVCGCVRVVGTDEENERGLVIKGEV